MVQREFSAGAMIYRVEKGAPLYLLLEYNSAAKKRKTYWDLPKGHLEKGETDEQAAKREIKEETGLVDVNFIPGFKEGIQYYFQIKGKKVFKKVVFFLTETKESKVQLSHEHVGYTWLPYEQALSKLTYKKAKGIMQKTHVFLEKKQKQKTP